MYSDEQLRELMVAVDLPPSSADIGRAMATGRRRRRHNRIVLSAAALLAVSSAGYIAVDGVRDDNADRQAQTGHPRFGPVADCTVEVLDVPAGGGAGANAVDPAGRTIVGTAYTPQSQGNAVRFEGGRVVAYAGATGNTVAINAGGVLVGYDFVDEASHTLGWTYHDGKKSLLARLDGFPYTVPTAVNARGDVVGAAMGEGLDETVPVVWPADRPGTVRQLAVPAGFGEPGTIDARAVGVADDGTVAGAVHDAPIRWAPDGTPSALPVLDGYRYATPTALRGRYVYGWVSVIAENRNAVVRWDLDDGTMKVFDAAQYDVTDGTPDGWSLTAGGDSRDPARITPDGKAELLPLPENAQSKTWMDVIAHSISDDGGTIVGATLSQNSRPVIWRC